MSGEMKMSEFDNTVILYDEDGEEYEFEIVDHILYKGKTYDVLWCEVDDSMVPITDVKLFASKTSGAQETDRDRYSTSFDKNELKYVDFRLFINQPGSKMVVQRYLKIVCLDDGSTFYDDVLLQLLEADWVS